MFTHMYILKDDFKKGRKKKICPYLSRRRCIKEFTIGFVFFFFYIFGAVGFLLRHVRLHCYSLENPEIREDGNDEKKNKKNKQ